MVVFVYSIQDHADESQEQEIINFLETLIKICYTYDLSQDIKYKIFDINVRILNNRPLTSNIEEINDNFFIERRRLRNGFVMLYHYLIEDNWPSSKVYPNLNVERIVRSNDNAAHSSWPQDSFIEDIENMANFSIIDFPKTYKSLMDRSHAYNSSSLTSVSKILGHKTYYAYDDFINRKENMKTTLSVFLTSI